MGEMENEFLRAGNTENAGEGRAWRQGTVHVSPVATVKMACGVTRHTSHVTRHTSVWNGSRRGASYRIHLLDQALVEGVLEVVMQITALVYSGVRHID